MFENKFLAETALFLLFAVPLSVMDIRKFRISLVLTFSGIAAFAAYRLLLAGFLFPESGFAFKKELLHLILSLATSFLAFFMARVFSGNGLGKGDVIFGILTAEYCLFWVNLAGIFLSAVLGILFYLGLAVRDRFMKKNWISRPVFAIPFIPFITAGALLARILF